MAKTIYDIINQDPNNPAVKALKAQQNNKQKVEEAKQRNTKKSDEISLNTVYRVNPEIKTLTPNVGAPELQGSNYDPKSYEVTIGDRHPIFHAAMEGGNKAINTASDLLGLTAGAINSVIPYMNDVPYDPEKGILDYYERRLNNNLTIGKQSLDSLTKYNDRGEWVESQQPTFVGATKYALSQVDNNLNLSDWEKVKEKAIIYGDNPEYVGHQGLSALTQSALEFGGIGKVAKGAGIPLSAENTIMAGNAIPIATAFANQQYQNNGKLTWQDVVTSAGVGVVGGKISQALSNSPHDLDSKLAKLVTNNPTNQILNETNTARQIVKAVKKEGSEEVLQGEVEYEAANILNNNPVGAGALPNALDNFVLGIGAGGISQTPTIIKGMGKDAVAFAAGTPKQAKKFVDNTKKVFSTETQKEFNQYQSELDNELTNAGNAYDSGNMTDVEKHRANYDGVLVKASNKVDDLTAAYANETDPKKKAKIKKDLDRATTSLTEMRDKRDAYFGQFDDGTAVDTAVDKFIQYRQDMINTGVSLYSAGVKKPDAPITPEYTYTPSGNAGSVSGGSYASHGFSDTNKVSNGTKYGKSLGFKTNFKEDALAGGVTKANTLGFAKVLDNDGLGGLMKNFSAFNDGYHVRKSPNSKHTQGVKFDLSLTTDDLNTYKQTKARIEQLAQQHGYVVKVTAEHRQGASQGLAGFKWYKTTTGNHFDVEVLGRAGAVNGTTSNQGLSGKHTGIHNTVKGKSISYSNDDGSVTTKVGGTISWRNNNVGNLRMGNRARRFGAIGENGGFAVFPTLEAGEKAREDLLFNGYANKDLMGAIATYAPDVENDTARYQQAILKAVGSNKLMKDYTASERKIIMDAMKHHEGYKEGTIQGADYSYQSNSNNMHDTLAQMETDGLSRLKELRQQWQNEENEEEKARLQEQIEDLNMRLKEIENLRDSETEQPQDSQEQTQEQAEPEQSTAEKLADLVRYSREMRDEHILKMQEAGVLTDDEVVTLRQLSKVNQLVNENKTGDTVVSDIYKGSVGRTAEESNRGLSEYQERLLSGVSSGVMDNLPKLADDLYTWEKSHTAKARASQEAFEMFKQTGMTYTVARDAQSQEWKIYEGEFSATDRKKYGAITINGKSARYVQNVTNEAAHIQQMASAYHAVLKDSPNMPARRLADVELIDFDSLNIKPANINAHNPMAITRGGDSVDINMDAPSQPVQPVEPIVARSSSKSDDMNAQAQVATSTRGVFNDYNPQVSRQYNTVNDFKSSNDGNNPNSVWIGRGTDNNNKTRSISAFVYSGARKNEDGSYTAINNVVDDNGNIATGAFGYATNVKDINNSNSNPNRYLITHDGTQEGKESAYIEQANRFTDMMRLVVRENANYAQALVGMATNPQLQLHGDNYSTNAYSEATVLNQILPVVANAIKGYDSPKKQQEQIIKALDNMGTFMSDGTFHQDVPRALDLNESAKGLNKLNYEHIVHNSESYQSVNAGAIQASGTFTPSNNQDANMSAMSDNTQDINDALLSAAQDDMGYDGFDMSGFDTSNNQDSSNQTNQNNNQDNDMPWDDSDWADSNTEFDVSGFNMGDNQSSNNSGEQIADENTVFDMSGFEGSDNSQNSQNNNQTTEPTTPQRLSTIPTNQRSNAKTKEATKMGMTAIKELLANDKVEAEPVKPQLNDVLHKTVTAKEVADIINPVKPINETNKGNVHPQAVHHAEIQGIIETLDKYNPNMKAKVVKESIKNLTDNDVIHVSVNSKDMHTDLARGMLKQSIGKISDEIDELTDNVVSDIKDKDPDSLNDTEKEEYHRTRKLVNLRSDIDYVKKQVNKYLRDNVNTIDKDLQTKLMYSVMSPSTLLNQGLLDKDVKGVLKSIKLENKSNSKIKNAYQALKNAVSKYLGFNSKQDTAYDKLLDVFAGSVELSVADGVGNFTKATDAKLSVFQTDVDIQKEHGKALKPVKDKITDTKNVLTTYFKQTQSKNKPLSAYSNFVDNLVMNPVKASQKLGLDVPSEVQNAQIKDFWTFHHEFKDYLQDVVAKKTQGYEFASMASYFLDENNQIDENLLGALSYTVYDYIIANGNHVKHTDDEIKQLLGLYDEEQRKAVYLTKELRETYQNRGFVYDIQAQKIGERVAKTLNIFANELGSMELDSRLYSALGGWAISAMQAADLVHITQMSTKHHLENMAQVNLSDAKIEWDKVSDHSTTRFMSVGDLKGNKVNPRLKEIIDTNKGTAGYLSDIFGGVSAKRQPLTKAPEQGKVKRSVKGTKSQVADVQAELVDKAQQEPMVVNEDFNHVVESLMKEHEDAFLQTIGAKVSDEKLAKSHINERAGMLGSADGIMRDLTNAVGFFAGLGKNNGVRQFWDTMFMAKNTRMHLNSNVVNIQSSKLHRAWADLASYKTNINLKKGNHYVFNSMIKKLDKHNQNAELKHFTHDELKLMIFLRALGENMEGSEEFIEAKIKEDPKLSQIFIEGFTVDKLPSYVFIPLFLEYLNQDHIKQATTAMGKVLASEKISNAEMQSIQNAVSDMDMGASSLRALMEWSRYTTAAKNKESSFNHSLGLGSDGINNGVMLAHVNNGTADETMQLRTGLFSHASEYTSYHNARHNPNLGDYYTEFKNQMLGGITQSIMLLNSQLSEHKDGKPLTADEKAVILDKIAKIKQIQLHFKTLNKRKSAKDVLVPVNYGSGETATINSVYRRFLGDIQGMMADIANKAKEYEQNQEQDKLQLLLKDTVEPLVVSLNTLLNTDTNTAITLKTADGKDFVLNDSADLTQLSEVWFSDKDVLTMGNSFEGTIGRSIWDTLTFYEGDFLQANRRNIGMLQAATEAYVNEYENAYEEMKEAKLGQLTQKYKDLGLDDKAAGIQAKTELEFVGLTYNELNELEQKLSALLPTVHTPHSIEGNDEKAKIHLVNTVSQSVSGNSELTQNNFYMMNEQGLLQSTTSSSATKKMAIDVAARVANSIQTQSQDARISSQAMAGTDTIHSNVHDANISGGEKHIEMAQAQNKAAYDTIRKYSAQLESLQTLWDKVVAYANYLDERAIDKSSNETYINMLSVAYNSFGAVRNGDLKRQEIIENLKTMHQYGAEFGQYDITADDVKETKKIFNETNERFEILYAAIAETVKEFDVEQYQVNYPKAANHNELFLTSVLSGKYDEQVLKYVTNQANTLGFSGSHINPYNYDNYKGNAVIENNARKYIPKKQLKELDASRFMKGSAGNTARDEYTKLINIINNITNSDAVYLENGFYDDKEGIERKSKALTKLLPIATKLGKPLYAAKDNQWRKYDPISKSWVDIDTPALAKNSMYYSESWSTKGLDMLLNFGIQGVGTIHQSDQLVANKEYVSPYPTAMNEITNHSGGAKGADTQWDIIGREFGVTNHVHYYHGDVTPLGNTPITEQDFNEGRYEAAKAAKRNFGYTYNALKNSLLIRNWSQVKYADSIFAVGAIVKTGEKLFPNQKNDTRNAQAPSVTGGTGYAVGMAILHNKPTYVFNQKKGSYDVGWYKWDNEVNDFVPVDSKTLTLTKNFAGIGTREISNVGMEAIRDVYENTQKRLNQANSNSTSQEQINQEATSTEKQDIYIGADDAGVEFRFPSVMINNMLNIKDALPEIHKLDSGRFLNTEMDKVWDSIFDLAEKVNLDAAILTLHNNEEDWNAAVNYFKYDAPMFANMDDKTIVLNLNAPYNMDYRSKEMVAHEITHLLVPFLKPEYIKEVRYIRDEILKVTPNLVEGSPLDYMLKGGTEFWSEMFTMGLTYPDVREYISTITMSNGENALTALQRIFDNQVNNIHTYSDYYRKVTNDFRTKRPLESRTEKTGRRAGRASQKSPKEQRGLIEANTYQEFEEKRQRELDGMGDNSAGTGSSQSQVPTRALDETPKRSSRVGKEFNNKDIEKVFNSLKPDTHVSALFNSLFPVLVKQQPNLKLTFVADGNFNAKYNNGVITINESVWVGLKDNEKVRLLNHEIGHAVTLKGLEHKEHQAVKDLYAMYNQLKGVYLSNYKDTATLKAIFETADDMEGLSELITYGMENSAVADFIKKELNLADAGVSSKKSLGIFEQFWAAVQSMLSKLGFKDNYTTFLANIESVIELNGQNPLNNPSTTVSQSSSNNSKIIKYTEEFKENFIKKHGKDLGSYILLRGYLTDESYTDEIVYTSTLKMESVDARKVSIKGFEDSIGKFYIRESKDIHHGVFSDASTSYILDITIDGKNYYVFGDSYQEVVERLLDKVAIDSYNKEYPKDADVFNKTLSEQDIIKEYDDNSPVSEVFNSIHDDIISSEHSAHLANMLDKIYSTAYESTHISEDKVTRLYAGSTYTKAPAGLFKLSPKEAHAYSALATSIEHLLVHQNDNQVMIELKEVVGQMIEHFDDVRKLYPEYDSMTEIEKERANRQYGSLLHDVSTDKATAHIIAISMVSESMKDRLNIKVDKTSHIKDESWFDKFMAKVYQALNLLRDKFIYQSETSSDAMAELSIKLAKIDANIREGKMNMVDTMYHWAYTKPMGYANDVVNKIIDTGLDKASELLPDTDTDTDDTANQTEISILDHAKNVARVTVNAAKDLRNENLAHGKLKPKLDTPKDILDDINEINKKIPTVKEVKQKTLNMYADDVDNIIRSTGRKEMADLFEELRGQYDKASKVLERLISYNNKAQQERVNIKENFIKLAKEWFNSELDDHQKESISRHVLLTDAQSLLNYHTDDGKVKDLIISKAERAKRRSELEKKLKQLVPDERIRNDMRIQIKNLGYYMSNETTTPNLLKSAEMIATSSGTPWAISFDNMNQDVFETVDELVTLYALDTAKSKYANTVKELMLNHEEAMFNVLRVQQATVNKSKEEFKDNPLNYNKGYTPAIHDPRVDIKAVYAEDVQKYIDEGYDFVNTDPLPQDGLDPTQERYLMVNTNYAATRRVSGAADLMDNHHKGFEVLHYKKDGKELSRIGKEQLQQRMKFAQMDADSYNPKDHAGSNLIPVVGIDGMIIHYQYEMEGTTRDSILKRDMSFDMLMGTHMAALEVNPQIKSLQSSLGKSLVAIANDPIEGFKLRPHLYTVLTPNSKDPEVQEILRLMPYNLRKELEAGFGKGKPIVIPKRSMNVIFGFKKWSVAEWFDIATGEQNTFQKLITALYKNIYGNKAKNKAHEHQMVWEWFVKQAKDIIVIRSIKVLKGNIIANMLMLALQGVPIGQMVKDTLYAWREGKRYNTWDNERAKLQLELKAYSSNPSKVKELQSKLKKLEYQMQSSGMHKYMQEGIMSTLVEGIDMSSETKVFKSDFENKLDEYADKVPKPIRTMAKWVSIHPDTKAHQFLSEMTQFSDMAAKYVLARHIEKQQLKKGKKADDAFMTGIFAAQEAFINYDVPTGRKTQLLNDLGVLNFTKFTFRFQKVMFKQLHENTGHTLAQHFLVENVLGTAGVLNPLVPIPNVGWGVGTVMSAPSELPLAQLFL